MTTSADGTFLHVARRVCTPAEQDAIAHALAGHSQLRTAIALGISRRAVRDRLDNAYRKIDHALATPRTEDTTA